jgi:hypothetical protein
MGITPAGKVGHRYFATLYRVISDSACRNLTRIVENGKNMSQERLKHHRSPNGGLPTGVRDEVPGEAEGRSAESARADILCRQDDARCGRSSRCAVRLQAPTKGMAKRGRVAEVPAWCLGRNW